MSGRDWGYQLSPELCDQIDRMVDAWPPMPDEYWAPLCAALVAARDAVTAPDPGRRASA